MLVVDPKQRFTATDVLNHSFFSQYVVHEVRQFTPFRRFKVRNTRFYQTKNLKFSYLRDIFYGIFIISRSKYNPNSKKTWILLPLNFCLFLSTTTLLSLIVHKETITFSELSPSGYLLDRSRYNANLLQLSPCQAHHQGGDKERPVRREAHPQAHRCVRL